MDKQSVQMIDSFIGKGKYGSSHGSLMRGIAEHYFPVQVHEANIAELTPSGIIDALDNIPDGNICALNACTDMRIPILDAALSKLASRSKYVLIAAGNDSRCISSMSPYCVAENIFYTIGINKSKTVAGFSNTSDGLINSVYMSSTSIKFNGQDWFGTSIANSLFSAAVAHCGTVEAAITYINLAGAFFASRTI